MIIEDEKDSPDAGMWTLMCIFSFVVGAMVGSMMNDGHDQSYKLVIRLDNADIIYDGNINSDMRLSLSSVPLKH